MKRVCIGVVGAVVAALGLHAPMLEAEDQSPSAPDLSETPLSERPPHEIWLEPGDDLTRACAAPPPGTVIHLAAGTYALTPHPYVEPECGNCEDPNTPVTASVGLVVSGSAVEIVGEGADRTTIETRAGYGLLFEGCRACKLTGVTVTGGIRDADSRATDAGIVAKHSTVEIAECVITDNIGDEDVVNDVVVGIMGVTARAGSEVWVHDNRIARNSWDGVAFYRDAAGAIENNVIDGIDRARGSRVGGGRGVGIGLTWNANALVRGNLVRNYWKGIGIFVDASAKVEENIVESVLTWGISLWDAEKGSPTGWIQRNVVYDTGACGVSIALSGVRPDSTTTVDARTVAVVSGQLLGNVIARSGQDARYDSGEPYCLQTSIAEYDVPEDFRVFDNLLFENREAGDSLGVADLTESEFRERLPAVLTGLAQWSALEGATFLERFR